MSKYTEKQLRNWYKKYVEDRVMLRMVSEEYIPRIKKYGFEHNKDPFSKVKSDVFQFFDILLELKKKGFIMMRWWGKPVDQELVINCSKGDLNLNYIDFTSEHEFIIKYYLNLPGGAFVQTILIFTEEILMKKPPLTDEEIKLVKKLNRWSKRKAKYKNKVIRIKATSNYFENAVFQRLKGKKEIESPLGSFENFSKIISKNGFKIYQDYLTDKKLFHIRTINKIPAKEILSIKNK